MNNDSDRNNNRINAYLLNSRTSKGKHNKRLKKRAVVAVARKLAVLLHTLWRNGIAYEPFYQRQQGQAPEETA